jgi:hypothetical protein
MLCHSYNSDIKIQIVPSNFVTVEAISTDFLLAFSKQASLVTIRDSILDSARKYAINDPFHYFGILLVITATNRVMAPNVEIKTLSVPNY